jgi:hypothetical protein
MSFLRLISVNVRIQLPSTGLRWTDVSMAAVESQITMSRAVPVQTAKDGSHPLLENRSTMAHAASISIGGPTNNDVSSECFFS